MTFYWKGLRISLSFWFFCGAVLLLTADRSGLSGLFFLAIALHEGGHLLYMLLARLPLGEISLTPLGLILSLRPECHPAAGESLLLNLSGCAANLAAAALLPLFPGGGMAALRLSAVNAALGILNLLPIPGLDGDNVVVVNNYYKEKAKVGSEVVVMGGSLAGCECAIHLAQEGKVVRLVEMREELAPDATVR